MSLAADLGVDGRSLAALARADPKIAAILERAKADPALAARLAAEVEARRPQAAEPDAERVPFVIDPAAMDAPINLFAVETLGFTPKPGQATVLAEIYRDNIRTAVLRIGRRGGKGRTAAIVATYEATVNAELHRAAVEPDEQVGIVVVATRQKQARQVHKYIAAFLKRYASRVKDPVRIIRESDDEIELSNGFLIITLPCSAAAARGSALAVVILDEAAWFEGLEGSPIDVGEIADALFPATAQFPAGKRIVLSTPRWPFGWFYELCKDAATGIDPRIRHWHATTAEYNPDIESTDPGLLASEERRDPVKYRREYLAEFVDVSADPFLEARHVDAVIRPGPLWMPPPHGPMVIVSLDPAWEARGDAFALAVGWQSESGRIVIGGVESWRGKDQALNVDEVLDRVAARCIEYGAAYAITDQGTAQPVIQGLEKRGVTCLKEPLTNTLKWDVVSALRTAIRLGVVELPPDPALRAELLRLELSQTPSGKPSVKAGGSGHDDLAMAVATVCWKVGTGNVGVLLHV